MPPTPPSPPSTPATLGSLLLQQVKETWRQDLSLLLPNVEDICTEHPPTNPPPPASIPVPSNQNLSWNFLFTVAHACTHTSFFIRLQNFVFLAGTYEHMNSTAYVLSCCCSVENASSVKVGTGFVKLITLFTTPGTDRFSIIISEWRMERISELCPTDLTGGCQFGWSSHFMKLIKFVRCRIIAAKHGAQIGLSSGSGEICCGFYSVRTHSHFPSSDSSTQNKLCCALHTVGVSCNKSTVTYRSGFKSGWLLKFEPFTGCYREFKPGTWLLRDRKFTLLFILPVFKPF